MVLALLTPAALLLPAASSPQLALDIILGVAIPLHSHVALNYVITDYVPKSGRTPARALLLATTIIAAAGILKLNMEGPGLTESVKSLWRAPKKAEGK